MAVNPGSGDRNNSRSLQKVSAIRTMLDRAVTPAPDWIDGGIDLSNIAARWKPALKSGCRFCYFTRPTRRCHRALKDERQSLPDDPEASSSIAIRCARPKPTQWLSLSSNYFMCFEIGRCELLRASQSYHDMERRASASVIEAHCEYQGPAIRHELS